MTTTTMNQTKINRSTKSKTNTYTRVDSRLLSDSRLTASAIGLMVMMLNNSDDWVLYVQTLKKNSGLTRTQFYAAWELLQKHQYVIVKQEGKNSWHITVNECGDLGLSFVTDGMSSGAY